MTITQWAVFKKGDNWDAVSAHSEAEVHRLSDGGWQLMGCPAFKYKEDAINWVEECTR